MVGKKVSVTDVEQAVLKVLWAQGPLPARAITESLYSEGAESAFAAVHSFLQRLERKGLVARDRIAYIHVFTATASRVDILRNGRLRAEKVVGREVMRQEEAAPAPSIV